LDISNESRKKNGKPKYYFHFRFMKTSFDHMNGVIDASLDFFSIG